MNKLEQAKRLCVETLLVPYEGYARKLSNGDCEAYPDPASPLFKLSKDERSKLTEVDYERLGQPWTIGFGSTYDEYGIRVRPGDIWTQDKAMQVKQKVLDKFLVGLLGLSPGLANEDIYRIAAVLSWVYNIGLGSYRISTFKKRIDAKDWEGAAEECLKWNKAQGKILKGLTKRRKHESLYLLGKL